MATQGPLTTFAGVNRFSEDYTLRHPSNSSVGTWQRSTNFFHLHRSLCSPLNTSRAMSYRTLAYARYFKAYNHLINELVISKVFNLHKSAISYASSFPRSLSFFLLPPGPYHTLFRKNVICACQ